MKKILSLIAAVLIYPQISQGTECVNVPTCAEMGYTLTAPKGDGWICTACPTDPKKFSCSEKPCPPNSSTTQTELRKTGTVSDNGTFIYDVYCPTGYQGDSICYNKTPIRVYVHCGGVTSVAERRARGACKGLDGSWWGGYE